MVAYVTGPTPAGGVLDGFYPDPDFSATGTADATTFLRGDNVWATPAGGASTTADFLVGTADAGLTNEIVVGPTPGGELGGTWPSPTVDAIHSGTSHASILAASDPLGSAAAAQANAIAASQPLDSDLTAIAALTTTAFGRTFLDLADAIAARTKLALGTAAIANKVAAGVVGVLDATDPTTTNSRPIDLAEIMAFGG